MMTVGDLISSVVALATAIMAAATYFLAKATTDATRQAERHHQENQRPFCVITFPGASQQFPFGPDFDPEMRWLGVLAGRADDQPSTPDILIQGDLQNKGSGPAKDVFVYLNKRIGEGESGAIRLTRLVFASVLVAANETIAVDIQITEQDVIQAWDGERWKPTQVFYAIAGETYEIVLEYQDVFENPFHTIHPRGIWTPPVPNVGDPTALAQMMVQPNRPSPIFRIGRQPVQTLADMPIPSPISAPFDSGHQF